MKNTHRGFILPLIIGIVAIILAVGGYYFYVSGSEPLTPPSGILPTGIIITSVKPNDLVKLPLTVEGYLDGGGWTANEGEIGTVEIFDGNGKSVSNRAIIRTTSDWLKFPTYFRAIVGDREMMSYISTDNGVVKITSNGAKDGERTKSVSIPVRFR